MAKKKIYLIAGEASGDALGSRIIENLKGKVDIIGIGGPLMKKQGMKSLFPMEELSLMGFVEILPHLPKLIKRINQTVDDIIAQKPDMVVTIDAPGFNFRVQKKLRKKLGKDAPYLMHYVAPTVWVWKPKRAEKISKFLDGLMVILPFEPPYFEKHGLKTFFVGHSILESGADKGKRKVFRDKIKAKKDEMVVCILPGSRKGEVERLMPVYKNVIEKAGHMHDHVKFILPAMDSVKAEIKAHLKHWDAKIRVVSQKDKWDAFAGSDIALAASGSVALELGMAKLPMVIAYKVSAVSAWIFRRFAKVPFVCLINILKQKQVVPELIQENCQAEKIYNELNWLIENASEREIQKSAFDASLKMLRAGRKKPSQAAASVILDELK